MASLFSDYLTALGVPHTEEYSDGRFAAMPFQSMFGLANLLKEYGVESAGVRVAPESRAAALPKLPVPFLADTLDGFAIVTAVEGDSVSYLSQHKPFTATIDEVCGAWNGIALVASKDSRSSEPDYAIHRIAEIANSAKRWAIGAIAVALAAFAMWRTELYSCWWAWLLLAFNSGGLMLSWMLIQKSLGIKNKAADAVCSVLEEGGCDELARSAASSLMGIVKWSEVGLGYFSVSLLAMLLFPSTLPALAAINILCLPYTFWSILYQRFKARTWCTLCVSVQCTLWLLFVTYLLGGWVKAIFPLHLDIAVLACVYVIVTLLINRLDNALSKYIKAYNKQ